MFCQLIDPLKHWHLNHRAKNLLVVVSWITFKVVLQNSMISVLDRFETTVRYTKFNCRKNISMDEDLQIESDSSLCRKRNVHEIDRRPTSDRRRKSIEDNVTSNLGNSSGSNHINHIVSILKRKDSSNSSNASLVTFSPSVVETIRYYEILYI